MNKSMLIIFSIIIGIVSITTALKNDECEGKCSYFFFFVYALSS